MRALPWTMLLGMGTILTAALAQAQRYDPRYPVCRQVYSREGSFIGCGYTSMAQCTASASGRAAPSAQICFGRVFETERCSENARGGRESGSGKPFIVFCREV